jgi:polysaccharide biosynthesis protein PslG
MRRALAGVVAVAALLAAAPAQARVPASWAGVMADGPLTSHLARHRGEWRRMHAAHVGFVRTAFYWRDLEPARDTLRLRHADRLVLAAARHGLSILPVVTGAPAWASEFPGDLGSPPSDDAAYGAFLTALVDRYGRHGTLWAAHPGLRPRPVRAWQIWNEPNLLTYWDDEPFAPGYVRLLRAAHRALHRADRHAQLVLAGLPNESWVALQQIYQAGGRGLFDVVALHPYTQTVHGIVRIIRLNRRMMRQAHDRLRPVWLTEWSWPASRGRRGSDGNTFETSERGQARKLATTLKRLAALRHRLGIGRVCWYTWLSHERHATPFWAGYSGLRRQTRHGVSSARSLHVFARTVAALRR